MAGENLLHDELKALFEFLYDADLLLIQDQDEYENYLATILNQVKEDARCNVITLLSNGQ